MPENLEFRAVERYLFNDSKETCNNLRVILGETRHDYLTLQGATCGLNMDYGDNGISFGRTPRRSELGKLAREVDEACSEVIGIQEKLDVGAKYCGFRDRSKENDGEGYERKKHRLKVKRGKREKVASSLAYFWAEAFQMTRSNTNYQNHAYYYRYLLAGMRVRTQVNALSHLAEGGNGMYRKMSRDVEFETLAAAYYQIFARDNDLAKAEGLYGRCMEQNPAQILKATEWRVDDVLGYAFWRLKEKEDSNFNEALMADFIKTSQLRSE
jgi:hypothetical protein